MKIYRAKSKEYFSKKYKEFRERNKDNPEYWRKERARRKLYVANNKEKILARRAVSYAIECKKMVRGLCCVCGEIKTQAHHDNYKDRLNILWLCDKHHRELHKI